MASPCTFGAPETVDTMVVLIVATINLYLLKKITEEMNWRHNFVPISFIAFFLFTPLPLIFAEIVSNECIVYDITYWYIWIYLFVIAIFDLAQCFLRRNELALF